MSDEPKKGRKPDFYALQPIQSGKGENSKTYWNRIGAAWMLEEKEGIRIQLLINNKVVNKNSYNLLFNIWPEFQKK